MPSVALKKIVTKMTMFRHAERAIPFLLTILPNYALNGDINPKKEIQCRNETCSLTLSQPK